MDKPINDFGGDETTPLHQTKFTWHRSFFVRYRTLFLFFLSMSLFLLGVALGLLIGRLAFSERSHDEGGVAASSGWGAMVDWKGKSMLVFDAVTDSMKAENIRTNLRGFTAEPHIAGSDRNNELGDQLQVKWQSYGFDNVEVVEYTVLLTYPNQSAPNVLTIIDSNTDNVIYKANTTKEEPLEPGESNLNVVPPYNAYSGVGTVEGTLVYCNYGRQEDFEYLVTEGISFNDSVCIARYGNIYRGNKASLAQHYGCKGLIIYSDPADYNPGGGPTFPDSWSLPSSGLQRGTLSIMQGDVLTPDLPAIDGVHRRLYQDVLDQQLVPSIPVQPISSDDAERFLALLGGKQAPDDWQGAINITYNLGPAYGNGTELVHLEVNNEFMNKTIKNVIGQIYGNIEPDKLVLLGNHRDAWVFGGADPNSGTAVLAEIARVLGDLRNAGWRPGRTIVLCSWDAEEFSLLGSTEWTQDFNKILSSSALSYLNVDVAIGGHDFFAAGATPLLYNAIYEATKMVKCPDPNYDTVYNQWQHYSAQPGTRPHISNLGSGSDFTAFLQNLGITSSDFQYTYAEKHLLSYPVYHSVHDTFYWMEQFVDANFEHHRALGLVWLNVALQLATVPILPYNVVDYSTFLQQTTAEFSQLYEQKLLQNNISLKLLNASVDAFTESCTTFDMILSEARSTNQTDNRRRMLNNKLQELERAFLFSDGLPNRPFYKHLIFAPSVINSYAGSVFPGVVDALAVADTFAEWQLVDRQLSLVAVHMRYAAQVLDQFISPQ